MMSRVPRHQTSSCFLLLLLLFVSGTFVAGSEETTQRTLRATLLGDAVAETLSEVDRVSVFSDSAASLVSSSLDKVLLTEKKKLVDEMVVVVAGRKEGGRRRLGAQKGVYTVHSPDANDQPSLKLKYRSSQASRDRHLEEEEVCEIYEDSVTWVDKYGFQCGWGDPPAYASPNKCTSDPFGYYTAAEIAGSLLFFFFFIFI